MPGKIFDSTTIGFIVAAIVLFVILCVGDVSGAISATRDGLVLFLRYLVLILSAMLVATYVQALIPKDLVTAYLGKQSGLRGIVLGTVVGGLTPRALRTQPCHFRCNSEHGSKHSYRSSHGMRMGAMVHRKASHRSSSDGI